MDTAANGTLTAEQAATYIGVRPSTIRAWVLARRIPFVKVGRLTRFLKHDLDQFLENGRVPAAS